MNTRYSGRRQLNTQRNEDDGDAYEIKKTRKIRKKTGPFHIFLITLLCVIALGSICILVICLPRYISRYPKEEINLVSFVEAIPETLLNDASNTDENKELPETETEGTSNSKYADVIKDSDYLKENNIYLKDAAYSDKVTLGFTGDILFDDEYAVMSSLILRGGNLVSGISEDALDVMNNVDIMVVNNEFPYTNRGERKPDKQYTFRADTSTVSYLDQMGADVAILANNHVYDYGETGLLDTLDTLENAGICPVGAGRNIAEACRPVYFIVNDIKIAIVAATQIERLDIPDTKGATETSPGVFRAWNSSLIYDVVKRAKEEADYVVVCIHWGTEKESEPDQWQLSMAPKLEEAGADLIVGDHPHRLQGIYCYNDTPCIYSLGNFWFNGSELDTGILRVTIDKDGTRGLEFLPAVQANYRTSLVGGDKGKEILNRMRSLSKGVSISEDGHVSRENR